MFKFPSLGQVTEARVQMLLSFKRLLGNTDGAVALTFSLVGPVLLLAAALAVDSASLNSQAAKVQSVADATALAVAKELHLLANETAAQEAGVARAEALLAEAGLQKRPHTIEVQIDRGDNRVRVNIDLVGDTFLPAKASGQENPIKASSEAQSYGQVRLCVLGLNRKSSDTILARTGQF
jgi:Flp pilus assembly protein TadG